MARWITAVAAKAAAAVRRRGVGSPWSMGRTYPPVLPRQAGRRSSFGKLRRSRAYDRWRMPLVLLVEDDAAIAEPLARALRREGYDVELLTAGDAVVGRVGEGGVDLVLLDLGLPGLDGVEVCRRLRAGGDGL